ncbi:MAG: DUF3644 domain-containing protein [Candidatus Cloacimonetes bacterium]|nr:DUF3644 domain-containing protein [Candidatus Cloacimonadota bacterium]
MKQHPKRRFGSITKELITKSREAALAAVQIFNSPTITFKSEIYIVLMNIAWTYLLHAYYRKMRIEYRYFDQKAKRRKYHTTKSGAYKYWELERCLNDNKCPLDKDSKNNLMFLIGIRHEIEHKMTTRIDESLSAKFQACCVNYNESIKGLFGDDHGIDKHLALSLQFTAISQDQLDALPKSDIMPLNIKSFIDNFEKELSDADYNSPKYACRFCFEPKLVNHKGQADRVIQFIRPDSPLAANKDITYGVIKESEKMKYRPSDIVSIMNKQGYKRFNMSKHTNLWKEKNGKDVKQGYGVEVAGTWYWYEAWVDIVRQHCVENAKQYGKSK